MKYLRCIVLGTVPSPVPFPRARRIQFGIPGRVIPTLAQSDTFPPVVAGAFSPGHLHLSTDCCDFFQQSRGKIVLRTQALIYPALVYVWG